MSTTAIALTSWPVVAPWSGFAPLDRHLGQLLFRLAVTDPPTSRHGAAIAAAALSAASRNGDACLDITEVGATPCPGDTDDGPVLPAAHGWLDALHASSLVGDGSTVTPLVLDGVDRIYLYRYFHAERRLAQALLARAHQPPRSVDGETLRRLFPCRAEHDAVPWQAVAAFAAARSALAVITGGPGTGKTWTVARLLALRFAMATVDAAATPSPLRIHLAAPTGKAATRLRESIAAQLGPLGIDPARIPDAQTLHKLLGYHPGAERFAFSPQRLLDTDLVILDEASMVDLLLMDALFAAVPPTATVVLLGDPDQLASVATGYVLGALSTVGGGDAQQGGNTAAFAAAWDATGMAPTVPTTPNARPIDDCMVRLTESRRFDAQSGLGALARAIGSGDGDGAVAAAGAQLIPQAQWTEPMRDHLDRWVDGLAHDEPDAILHLLTQLQVLCAPRTGPAGVSEAVRTVETLLRQRGVETSLQHYHGRPILVTANDHGHRLYNGDIGVCWWDGNRTMVVFPDGEGGTRHIPPGRLPPHETAWALTVHKSQGSEYDRVILLLPDSDSPLASRELLYTAVTRARHEAILAGTASALRAACARRVVRRSGLADALRDT